MIQIIPFTGTLAYAGKHGIAAVLRGNITDQFLNQHGLSHTRTAKEADLTALLIGAQQVYHLDTGLQQFRLCGLLLKIRRRPVDGLKTHTLRSRLVVNGLSQHIEDTSQGVFTHRHSNRRAGGDGFHASHQAVRGAHGNTSHGIVAQMLGYFHRQFTAVPARNHDCLVDFRQLALTKADIQHRTNDLGNPSYIFSCHKTSLLYLEFRIRPLSTFPGGVQTILPAALYSRHFGPDADLEFRIQRLSTFPGGVQIILSAALYSRHFGPDADLEFRRSEKL